MSELSDHTGAPARSSFVTVVAWIFIVMSGLATLIGIFQNIVVQAIFAGPDFQQSISAADAPGAPAYALFLLNSMRWIFLGALLVSAATLAAAIGLLKRMDWGRWLFIAMMALGIAWNLCAFGIEYWILSSAPTTMPGAEETMAQFHTFKIVMLALGGLMALGMSALFGWIIYRLLSPEIAREFGRG